MKSTSFCLNFACLFYMKQNISHTRQHEYFSKIPTIMQAKFLFFYKFANVKWYCKFNFHLFHQVIRSQNIPISFKILQHKKTVWLAVFFQISAPISNVGVPLLVLRESFQWRFLHQKSFWGNCSSIPVSFLYPLF